MKPLIHRNNQLELNQRLFDACAIGQVKRALQAFADGADLSTRNVDGWSPLHSAAAVGSVELCKALIDLGLNVHNVCHQGLTPLMLASGSTGAKSVELVEMLLAKGADVHHRGDQDQSTALHRAANGRKPAVVRLLVEHGADVGALDKTGQTPLHWTVKNDFMDTTIAVLEAVVASDGSTQTCRNKRFLLNVREKQNRCTPLDVAVWCNMWENALALIAYGADASFEGSRIQPPESKNLLNLPPLHAAAQAMRGKLVHRMVQLLKEGADVNALHNGMTAMDEARKHKRVQAMAVLSAHQAMEAINAIPELSELSALSTSNRPLPHVQQKRTP